MHRSASWVFLAMVGDSVFQCPCRCANCCFHPQWGEVDSPPSREFLVDEVPMRMFLGRHEDVPRVVFGEGGLEMHHVEAVVVEVQLVGVMDVWAPVLRHLVEEEAVGVLLEAPVGVVLHRLVQLQDLHRQGLILLLHLLCRLEGHSCR